MVTPCRWRCLPGGLNRLAPLILAVVLVLNGCAGRNARVRTVNLLPSESLPASVAPLGSLGIAAAWGTLEPRMPEPPAGRAQGFGRGAAAGARATVVSGFVVGALPFLGGGVWGCQGQGCGAIVAWFVGWTALGVVVAPAGAVVGGVAGAVKAQPLEQVERGKAALINAVAQARLPDSIRDGVSRLGLERTGHALVPLTRQGPEMGDRDVDTVLDILICQMRLERRSTSDKLEVWTALDPELALRVDVDARLIRASDGEVLRSKIFEEFGPARTFSAWAAADGQALREGLEEASSHLTVQVADYFFRAPPPATETKEAEPNPEPAVEPTGDDNHADWD
jgi:hypothetical protein